MIEYAERQQAGSMAADPGDYHAYLLRLWRAQQDQQVVWRASLDDPRTGERRGFASFDQLVDYLQETLEERPKDEEAQS